VVPASPVQKEGGRQLFSNLRRKGEGGAPLYDTGEEEKNTSGTPRKKKKGKPSIARPGGGKNLRSTQKKKMLIGPKKKRRRRDVSRAQKKQGGEEKSSSWSQGETQGWRERKKGKKEKDGTARLVLAGKKKRKNPSGYTGA